MMPRCRNGRAVSSLLPGLGSFSHALCPVLPALVGGPESSRLSTGNGAALEVSPPGCAQGTSALQEAWGHCCDLVSCSPACFVLASRIRALISTTHCTFLVFAVTEGNLKSDLKVKKTRVLCLSPLPGDCRQLWWWDVLWHFPASPQPEFTSLSPTIIFISL